MKNALIDPSVRVRYVTGWVWNAAAGKYDPVIADIPNSNRVAEVIEAVFPVAPPLFWTDCADSVVADQWYYDGVQNQLFVVPPPPPRPE